MSVSMRVRIAGRGGRSLPWPLVARHWRSAQAEPERPLVHSVALDLTINPASAAWVDEASTTPSATAPTS